jgi:hypothetical protein
MRRNRYDDPYSTRHGFEREVLRPDWGSPHPTDPNWSDGWYHGMRSQGGSWQARYDRLRRDREEDLRRFGGYQGRYGRPAGDFARSGLLRMEGRGGEDGLPRQAPRYAADYGEPGWQGGGVREDMGYLRQYNGRSPELRYGGDYRRSYGWAERAHFDEHYPDDGPTRERAYGGYNSAGWAPGTWPGPGSRVGRR